MGFSWEQWTSYKGKALMKYGQFFPILFRTVSKKLKQNIRPGKLNIAISQILIT